MTIELTRRCELKLEAAPPRFRQVRRIVQAQLRYWHLDPLIDPAVLGLTELLANVHKHAQPDKRCTVQMVHLDGCLTVSVHDGDPRLPVASLPPLLSASGRGMAIVAALSKEWGAWNEAGGGKTVWFSLADGHPAPPPPASPVAGEKAGAAPAARDGFAVPAGAGGRVRALH
ncbi:ATP-binding protein [Streptomyces capparidis]